MPKISVIIPARNAGSCIEKCLLSLKAQTFQDFEVIVVDDASRDRTGEIARRYARVIKSEENSGEGAARNLGAQEAKGDILVFTDADVIAPSGWLAKILEDMQRYNVKCVGGGYCGCLGSSFMEKFAHLELVYRRRNMPQFVNTLVSNNFACSRELFFEFGGFPERFKCEDLRLSFLISRKYPVFWDKDNGVYHYFKTALGPYLRQQYYFSRDTVSSYCQYPEMLRNKTHQGRLIYLETVLMFISLLGFFYSPLTAILFILLILIANLDFLLFLKKEGLPVIRAFLVILLRDLTCVLSIFSGMLMCAKDIAMGLFKRPKTARTY